jgi:Bacterial aa3 type cytochrome c oxidase subunit IV
MAADGEVRHEVEAHERGYSLFTAMMKWGTIISFIVAAVVVVLIAS